MEQPLAHWTEDGGDWFARVGPFQLEARIENGGGFWCVGIYDDDAGDDERSAVARDWDRIAGPCDVIDLMREAERALACHLMCMAETMRDAP